MPSKDEVFESTGGQTGTPSDGPPAGSAGTIEGAGSAGTEGAAGESAAWTGGSTGASVASSGAASGGTAPLEGGSSGSPVGTGGTATTSGLVAHFAFNETTGEVARNLVDATKNATYMGNCSHPPGRHDGAVGIRNQAGETIDWIELPAGLLSKLSATTLSLWVRDLSTARQGGRLFQFGSKETETIYFAPDDTNPAASVSGGHLGGTHAGVTFVDLWARNANLTDKDWHQVAFSWSAAGITLYIDGTQVGSKASPGAIPSDLGATSTDRLGRSLDDAFIALYAEIDDLRIYDRVLTSTEIAQLYRMR